MTARSPTFPPWAIFPLPPERCASLIVDMAVYFVTISSESLLGTLGAAGLEAEWIVPADSTQVTPGQVLLRLRRGGRALEMRAGDMQRLLLELVTAPTWVSSIDALLVANAPGRHPWPYYDDEAHTWI